MAMAIVKHGLKSVGGRVTYTYMPLDRVSVFQQVEKGDPRGKEGKCANCGLVFYFVPDPNEIIHEMACTLACERELGWYPKRPSFTPQPKPVVTETPVSDGEKKIIIPQPKVRAACQECGGPAKGRGFTHKEGCSLSCKSKLVVTAQKPEKRMESVVTESPAVTESPVPETSEVPKADVCQKCGGPAKGRGYKHVEGCELSTKAKLAAAKAEKGTPATCPDCGGPARGRGYTHAATCIQKTKTAVPA